MATRFCSREPSTTLLPVQGLAGYRRSSAPYSRQVGHRVLAFVLSDGRQIAFVYQQSANDYLRIFIVNADGNNLHSRFNTAFGNDTAPHFTPDAAHIQFARIAEDMTPDPPGPKPWDVYSATLDGRSAVPLTTQHHSTKWGPSFTGDGRRFVYGLGGLSIESLHVVSLDTPTKPGELLLFRIPKGPDSPIYASPTFAPDSRSIIFLAASQGTKAFDYDVFRLDLATNVLSQSPPITDTQFTSPFLPTVTGRSFCVGLRAGGASQI